MLLDCNINDEIEFDLHFKCVLYYMKCIDGTNQLLQVTFQRGCLTINNGYVLTGGGGDINLDGFIT